MMDKKYIGYTTHYSSADLFGGYCMLQEFLPDAGYSGKYNTIWAFSLLVEMVMQISKHSS